MAGVQTGKGILKSILAQVIANRYFSAEGIATILNIKSIQIVRIGLYQNRNIES